MERFKPISDEDLDYIDKRFTAYLFYNTMNGGRYYECSSCRQEGFIPKLKRTETDADWILERAKHNDKVRCPFCGAVCTLKNNGISKKRLNLWERRWFVLIEVTEAGEVLLRALDTWKGYANFQNRPHIEEKRRWILSPGKYEYYGKSDYSGEWWRVEKSITDAFPKNKGFYAYYYEKDDGYEFIGLERLKAVDFMRYCAIHEYLALVGFNTYPCVEARAVRYLCEYAVHPRLEMLVKCGLESVINEILDGRKRRGIIDWEEKTPWEALRLTKPEYKRLLQEKDQKRYFAVECLHRWRKQKPKARIEDAIMLVDEMCYREFEPYLKKYIFPSSVSVSKIVKCLNGRQRGYWRDYIDAAEKLGYDLNDPVVLFPKNLKEAHDTATSAVKYEANRKLEEEAEKSIEKRKHYNFVSGDYLIRVAETMQEIIDEGTALKHCVGGYAERHMKGFTTILFVRRNDEPGTPFCTVEFRKGEIVQAYCFKNTEPPQEIKEFLAAWLDYINQKQKKEEAGAEALAPAA